MTSIGFIGLGIMGSRMAQNLLNGGADLTVHNRTAEKAVTLLENGAKWAATPAALAGSNLIFTMLAHPDAVESAALGEHGFLDRMEPGSLWVDCSTVNPRFSRKMAAAAAQHGVRFLDAPVAGTKPQAQNAQLVFIVGGAANDLETAQPFFEWMGSRVSHVGANGMGSSLKVVVNACLAAAMATYAEASALGRGLGLDPNLLHNVLIGGPVTAPFLGMKKEMMINADYEDPQFPLQWMHKDLQMAGVAAYESGVPVPLFESSKALYQQAITAGLGEADFAAIYAYLNSAG